MKGRLASLAAGLLFAAGLALSGMTRPSKVIGFLDVAGAWDPSLAFVMAGALGVYALAAWAARRSRRPVPPTSRRVDASLVIGAALFGIGWGASGFCPGPAFVAAGAGLRAALWFVPAMLLGMALVRRGRRAPPAACGAIE